MNPLLVLIASLPLVTTTKAPNETGPEIMVFGSIHLDNPMRDIHNVTIDDVMAPDRQEQILALVERLEDWQPTKIALECPAASSFDPRADPQSRKHSGFVDEYPRYREGQRPLGRSEAEQIGFRLADRLDHERVYGIDSLFPYLERQLARFAKERGQTEPLDRADRLSQEGNAHLLEVLKTRDYIDFFRVLNEEESLLKSHQTYYPLMDIGGPVVQPKDDGEYYAGADMVAGWYQRNLRVFANVARLASEPDDRVLVLIGLGHAYLLRQFIRESPNHRLVDVAEVLAP